MAQFYKYSVLPPLVLIVVSVFAPARAFCGGEKFNIQEVPLVVHYKSVSFTRILTGSVQQIVTTPRYAAFISNRAAWIMFPKKKPVPLSKLARLPAGFDWYGTVCALGEKLLISVATYTEEQKQKDLQADRGGYVEGPRPAGMLVVSFNPPAASLITLVTVSETGHADDSARPAAIRPRFQSCLASGEEVYMGEYGYLARMNPDSLKTELLEFDDEPMINRLSIWKEGGTLWYAADEGGAGSWIEKLDVSGPTAEKKSSCTLMNDTMSLPDTLAGFKGRLFASSAAGLVEIDEQNRMFIQYRLSRGPKTIRVYKSAVINNQLWGLREDGWVRFDPDACTAVHYRLRGGNVSNSIRSLGYFDGAWFVATDKEVVRVK